MRSLHNSVLFTAIATGKAWLPAIQSVGGGKKPCWSMTFLDEYGDRQSALKRAHREARREYRRLKEMPDSSTTTGNTQINSYQLITILEQRVAALEERSRVVAESATMARVRCEMLLEEVQALKVVVWASFALMMLLALYLVFSA